MSIAKNKQRIGRKAKLQRITTAVENAAPRIVANGYRPLFGFYKDPDVAQLRERSLSLLEQHGVAIDHPGTCQLLLAAGATEASNNKCLKLPQQLVLEALEATPKTATLCAKDPAWDLQLPRLDGTFTMRTGTGTHGFIDPVTGNYRNLMLDDVDTIAHLSNHLDQVGFISHPFVGGVPEITADIHGVARLIGQTQKHIWLQPYEFKNVAYLMRIVVAAAGGEQPFRQRPIASCIATAFTPLEFKGMDVEAIRQANLYGLPIHACSLPTGAGTAPITMPGAVVMAAAEILAMVVLSYVYGAQVPIIATPLVFSLDVRTGRSLQSSIEVMQGISMAVQLMKTGFGLVTHTYGAGSDSPAPGPQAQAESALRSQLVSLSGADILGGVGQLECATVFSPIQAIIDNELGGMLNKYLQSTPVDDESTAWKDLTNIEPGGNFLSSEHTVRHCRNMYMPKVFQREDRDTFEANQRRDVLHNAQAVYQDILQRLQPDKVLTGEQLKEIEQIVQAANADIVG